MTGTATTWVDVDSLMANLPGDRGPRQARQALTVSVLGGASLVPPIAFAALIAILGANLLIDLLDSNMVQMMEDRKQTIERLMK